MRCKKSQAANTSSEHVVEFAGMKARPTLPRGLSGGGGNSSHRRHEPSPLMAAATVPWLLLAVLCVGEAGIGDPQAPTSGAFVLPKPPSTASWGALKCPRCTAASAPDLNSAGEGSAKARRRITAEGKQRTRERPGPPKLLPPAGASSFWDQPRVGQHTVCNATFPFLPFSEP
jgi:hypothetical protein